ncbi:MAG: hypothetical protein ACFFDN_35810 [Candidatus Hodarchaeota archaeon]
MKNFKYSKISIITANARLAEDISKHFRKAGEYFPLFDVVDSPIPNKDSIMFGEFKNECTKIANSIKYLKSKKIILAECQKQIITEFKKHFPQDILLEVKKDDIDLISKLPGFKKTNNWNYSDLFRNEISDIIAIEYETGENDLQLVIAKNLAAAENAKIVFLPNSHLDEVRMISDLFRDWMNSNDELERQDNKKKIINIIENKIKNISFKEAKTISFITRGIPYGFFPFLCPTTHFFSHRLLGVQILLGMLKSTEPFLRCTSVYLCDPHEFDHSETQQLSNIFRSKSYVVKHAIGKNATVRDVRNSTQYLPIDLFFYSTHCGEIQGRRVKERFTADDGVEHIICYDEVIELAPKPGSEMAQVHHYNRWISLDGIDWKDNAGKDRIDAGDLIDQYMKQVTNRTVDEAIASQIEKKDIGIVKGSDALKMHDFIFIPIFHQVGGKCFPIVFNNTCSSWREFAVRFAIACASVYIGTSVDISNPVAIQVATKFSDKITKGITIGQALYIAQKEFIQKNGYCPYLMYGYLFTNFKPALPRMNNANRFMNNLKSELHSWKLFYSKTTLNELKVNASDAISFLEEQLDNFIFSGKETQ